MDGQNARSELSQRETSARDRRIRAIELRTRPKAVINEDLQDDFCQMSQAWKSFAKRPAKGERKGRSLL
jgi:hypothetical protein